MPRWTYLALVLLAVTGCTVQAAASGAPISGWHVDSRVILAVAGAMSMLFWKLIDTREAALKSQLQALSDKIDKKFNHFDEKLNSISRLEYEIADVSKLSAKLDVLTARVAQHELEYARAITKIDGQLQEILRHQQE